MVQYASEEDKTIATVKGVLHETKQNNYNNASIEQSDESLNLETEILRAPASADGGEPLVTRVLGAQHIGGVSLLL